MLSAPTKLAARCTEQQIRVLVVQMRSADTKHSVCMVVYFTQTEHVGKDREAVHAGSIPIVLYCSEHEDKILP